jgi:hypothetical protein
VNAQRNNERSASRLLARRKSRPHPHPVLPGAQGQKYLSCLALFICIEPKRQLAWETDKVVALLKYKGTRALDELTGPNKGKIRLVSSADEKTYKKGKRSGSIFRAERDNIIHQMTTEEARTTEVSISKTEKGRYGNAHIRYDINDGLVDVILEIIPTEEQKTERAKKQKEKKDQRNMSKEEEHEIKEKS